MAGMYMMDQAILAAYRAGHWPIYWQLIGPLIGTPDWRWDRLARSLDRVDEERGFVPIVPSRRAVEEGRWRSNHSPGS